MPIRHILCLPTFGSPYLVASVEKNKTEVYMKTVQKAVDGSFEAYGRKDFVLHPMFCEQNSRWRKAQEMLLYAQTKVWVNDEGATKYVPNMATIIKNPALRVGGCPHLFGDVCLDIPDTYFQKNGIRPEQFALVEKGYEPEDDEDEKAKKAECLEKGWDYNESNGMIYHAVC